MPFEGASDPKLPSNVEGLSLKKRQQWVGAWNGRFADCVSDGGSTKTCESSAFAVANAAIKAVILEEVATGDKNMEGLQPEYWDFISRQVTQKVANYDPVGGTGEKACSNCQWFIAPAACAVVESYPDPIVPNGLSDLWRERINRFADPDPLEVIIVGEREAAVAAPHDAEIIPGIIARKADGSKQETKTEGDVDFPASDFAVVPDTSKPATWKLRIAEGSVGNVTVAQVARAITALQPGGFRGNRVSLSSDHKSQAIKRISSAIGRTGGTDDQKDNLRERLDGVKATADWFEILVTGPKALKDAISAGLLKMRANASAVSAGDPDVMTYDSGLTLYKDVDEHLRFVALMSNRYRDRDKEIIPEAAHREFVAALDAAGYKNDAGDPAMEAWLWHAPGTKWGEVDWAEYVNGFMVVSGTVDKGFEDVAYRLADDPALGVSHGFKYLTDEADRSIITHYRSFEFSALPLEVASNPYTALHVIQEEAKAMAADNKGIPDDKRPFIAGKLGEERASELEADTAKRDAALQAAGVESKAADPKAGDESQDPKPIVNVDALAAASVKAITESPVMTDMAAALKTVADGQTALDARMTKLEKSDDDKISDQFESRVGTVADKRPSQAADNVIEKTEAEKAGAPKFDIIAAVTDELADTVGIPRGA